MKSNKKKLSIPIAVSQKRPGYSGKTDILA